MEISKEEENLIRAYKIFNGDVNRRLRSYFTSKWNGEFQTVWNDSSQDGKTLLAKLPKKIKDDKTLKLAIESGKTDNWDATCLFAAISILKCGPDKSSISDLRKLRNKIFHSKNVRLSDQEKDDFFERIKKAYKKLNWPEGVVINIENDVITTSELKKLRARLESEKKAGKEM